ncbi:MAG: epoxyqueuosine reductase QueH [Coriobacteriia bacterium]|nr:epoxyqueuosine reductase QueH [Coriobacteriia bacterium]
MRKALSIEYAHITAVYCNPNIEPTDEYIKRRDACRNYTQEQGIDFVELQLDAANWDFAALPQEQRCRACYSLRLRQVAQWAIANDCEVVATTLNISPWQNLDAIACAGQAAVANFPSLQFLDCDFREHYRAAQVKAREMGIYCQNYCGCLPSRAEAQMQRAARRKRRC